MPNRKSSGCAATCGSPTSPPSIAAAQAGPVIPVYVLDDETPGDTPMGGASRWWLHQSLEALAQRSRPPPLATDPAARQCGGGIAQAGRGTGAAAVHAIRHYEPWWREAQEALGEASSTCNSTTAITCCRRAPSPPDRAMPYKIYTPFKDVDVRAIRPVRHPARARASPAPIAGPPSDDSRGLEPAADQARLGGRPARFLARGQAAALERFEEFLRPRRRL